MRSVGSKFALIATFLFLSTPSAWADGVSIAGDLNINIGGLFSSSESNLSVFQKGTSTLTLSTSMLDFMDVATVTLSGNEVTPIIQGRTLDGHNTSAIASASVTSVHFDLEGKSLDRAYSTGSLTFTTPPQKGISSGGNLTLNDWVVDSQTGNISANLVGANGFGTVSNLDIWKAGQIQTSITKIGEADGLDVIDYSITLSNLALTSSGRTSFEQSLGLTIVSKGTLNAFVDNGTMTTHVQLLGNMSDFTAAVPEPSTYALMGLGLVGIGLAARRRQAH